MVGRIARVGLGVMDGSFTGLGQGVTEGYGVQVGFFIRIVGVGCSVGVDCPIRFGWSVADSIGIDISVFEAGISIATTVGGKRELDTLGQINMPTNTSTAIKIKASKAMNSF